MLYSCGPGFNHRWFTLCQCTLWAFTEGMANLRLVYDTQRSTHLDKVVWMEYAGNAVTLLQKYLPVYNAIMYVHVRHVSLIICR